MKNILFFLSLNLLISCGIGYPSTSFYVKNTSDQVIYFNSTVFKHSQLNGSFEITRPFSVQPNDSILARQTYFKKDGENPQNWFTKFSIYPIDSILLNDPNKAENWKKYITEKGKPFYTFTLNQ